MYSKSIKKLIPYFTLFAVTGSWLLTGCSDARHEADAQGSTRTTSVAGTQQDRDADLQSQANLGEHLILIAGCHDCHTPKKMSDRGPELDFSLALSGHPAQMPPPDIDRREVEKKGLGVTQTLTAWVGPWGISYAANLTSDKTGIGDWTEENFFRAMREGKFKGAESGRMLLPPMPWEMYKHMTDEELKAIFAYLKSTKPIENVVPSAQPPLAAAGR